MEYRKRDQQMLAEAYESIIFENLEDNPAANSSGKPAAKKPNSIQYAKQYRNLVVPFYKDLERLSKNSSLKDFISKHSNLYNDVENMVNTLLNTRPRADLKYVPDIHLVNYILRIMGRGDILNPNSDELERLSDMIKVLQSIAYGEMPTLRDPWNTDRPYLNSDVVDVFRRFEEYFTPEFLAFGRKGRFFFEDQPLPR